MNIFKSINYFNFVNYLLLFYIFYNNRIVFKKVDIKSKIDEEFNNWKNINLGRIYIDKGIKNVYRSV